MKNFLSKDEACVVLSNLHQGSLISCEDTVALTSIRVCVAAEKLGVSLWGKDIEKIRPMFSECQVPENDAIEEVIENYSAYQKALANAKEYASS